MSKRLAQPSASAAYLRFLSQFHAARGSERMPDLVPDEREIIDVLATAVALRIGGDKLQPMLKEMKNNLRSKRYA